MSLLSIHLFGPFDVRIDGKPLPRLRSRKGQWLLALLILRHTRQVERSWLAATLWPDSGEAQALASLRQSLADLRQALGSHAKRLVSPTVHTLTFDIIDAEIDILAFDAAIARRDSESLKHAVSLYTGVLLEGCTEDIFLPERLSREQSYLAALGTLASSAAEHDDHLQAELYYRAIVAVDPFREEAHRGIMQALADQGNTAAITDVYRDLRRLFLDELNIEPSPETVALYRQLRSAPVPVQNTSMRVEPTPPIGSLPKPLTPLVGRESDVTQIEELFNQTRLVTLTGIGGVGKTRLSIQTTENLAQNYSDGVWFIDFSALSDPDFAPQAVASVLQISEISAKPMPEVLCEHFRDKSMLLIFDNCEHLIDSIAVLAARLLENCQYLKILATSRQPLGITGERLWSVSALSFPSDLSEMRSSSELLQFESVRLFVSRAQAAYPGFELTDRIAPAIEQICRRLDGIPLALELSAARLRLLSASQIAERLDDRFRLLTQGNRDAQPRQQTLLGALDWSYDLLSDSERALFRKLSVFAGGWTLASATGICAADDEDEMAILDLLSSLSDKSLLVSGEDVAEERHYTLQETIRQYAHEKLIESGELDSVRKRHLHWFVQYAEMLDGQMGGPEGNLWLTRLEGDYDNFRVALHFSEDAETCLRLVGYLWWFWYVRSRVTEGRQWLKSVLEGYPNAPIALRQKAVGGAGVLAACQGDFEAARVYFEQAIADARALGDRKSEARALTNLGNAFEEQGNYAEARRILEESLPILRAEGDLPAITSTLGALGSVANQQGDYEYALPILNECLAVAQATGSVRLVAYAYNHLGFAAYRKNENEMARSLYRESLIRFRQIGDQRSSGYVLNILGDIARREGDYETAQMLWSECLSLQLEVGDKPNLATSLEGCGHLAMILGDFVRAATLWGAADTLRHTTHALRPTAEQSEFDANVLTAKAVLGNARFQELWMSGAHLKSEDAVAIAVKSS